MCELMDLCEVFINLMGRTLLQCIHISNYHVVHFEFLTVFNVNYTSIRLKEKESKGRRVMRCGYGSVEVKAYGFKEYRNV